MAEVYDVGDVVRIRTSPVFANASGVATNPTTVTLTVRAPDGTETVYATGDLTSPGTGDYYRDVTATAAGVWGWEFVGTGTAAAAASGVFRVRVSAVD